MGYLRPRYASNIHAHLPLPTATRHTLWKPPHPVAAAPVRAGAHGQQLAHHLLAANHAPSSVEGRLQWLEARAEATQGEVAVLADDSDARFKLVWAG